MSSLNPPIPKFASFRPKPTSDDGEPAKEKTEARDKDSGKEDSRHGHHRHKSKDRDNRRRPHHHHHRLHDTKAAFGVVSEQSERPSSLFLVDRKGDPNNVVYGSIHRYEVPTFHRIGAGNVLGAPKSLKIDRDSIDDRGITLVDVWNKRPAKRKKYVFARNERKVARLLRSQPTGFSIDAGGFANADFISFSTIPTKRKRSGSDFSDSSTREGHYRSIEGKAKAITQPDEGMLYVTDSDSSDRGSGRIIMFDQAMRQRAAELSKSIEVNPTSVEAWLALIDHQDRLLESGDGGRRKATAAEKRSTADIKLHLYEKALSVAGRELADRERLLLGMMAEGSKIWDFKLQSEKWAQISRENLESVQLWKQYLDFRQSSFPNFRYEDIRGVFLERIRLLKSAIGTSTEAQKDTSRLYEHLLYTIVRASLFIREAGYSELALGIWQGLLELNYFSPIKGPLNQSHIDILQEFWEAEVPRIGDLDKSGWKRYQANPDLEVPEVGTDVAIPHEFMKASCIFESWPAAERVVASHCKLPARTMDDVAEDDPYRVILWSDIEGFIIELPLESPALKLALLDAFLLFCRLPQLQGQSHAENWANDAFIRNEILDGSLQAAVSEVKPNRVDYLSPSDTETPIDENPFQSSTQQFSASLDNLFPQHGWIGYFKAWSALYGQADTDGPVSLNWLRNVLRALLDANLGEDFAVYYLAFELCNEPQTVKKTAKGLLKQQPTSLKLYNAFALSELSRGYMDSAMNVINAALSMRTSLPKSTQKDDILLWRSWAWALLDRKDLAGSLRCLLSVADGSPRTLGDVDISSSATMLKARQHFKSLRDHFLSSSDMDQAIIYAECLALLEYLSFRHAADLNSQGQGDIEGALDIFDAFSETLTVRGHIGAPTHELLHQAAAKLLYYHIQSGPFRPALIRTQLGKSLTLFPSNTIFISLFAWNERRLRIDDRVRALLRDTVLTPTADALPSRLFAIYHEATRGNSHSTRAAFENAVASPACASSPALWRLFVLFCARCDEYRGAAKEVFYRAMRACPWAKTLYLIAFEELRDMMSFEELKAVYRVLGEKELRVHIDLEDRLEEMDQSS